jgi:MYXO-CTERM domain-containing protein
LIGAVCVWGLLLGAPRAAAAQQCDADDAGEQCLDDAGLDGDGGLEDDAGLGAPADAGSGSGVACSCDARSEKGGSIHVCTGSFDSEVCETLSCELGEVWQRPCSIKGVRLCCEMPARQLYANLYDDCTHANCRAGFFAQCQDFGGSVYEGPCRAQLEWAQRNPSDSGKDDDDDDGWCSVARGVGAGSSSGASTGGLLLLALALLGLRRRRA